MVALGLVATAAIAQLWLLAALLAVVFGAVSWVAGLWVGPWSADAYPRRIVVATHNWRIDLAEENKERRVGQQRVVEALARMQPPAALAVTHGELVARSRAATDSTVDSMTTARLTRELWGAFDALSDRADGRYCSDLQRLRVARNTRVSRARESLRAIDRRYLRRVRRARPRAGQAGLHAQLIETIGDLSEAHVAIDGDAPEAALAAAAHHADKLGHLLQELVAQSGYNDRWGN